MKLSLKQQFELVIFKQLISLCAGGETVAVRVDE